VVYICIYKRVIHADLKVPTIREEITSSSSSTEIK